MSVKVKENDYICDTCKHKKSCPQAWSFDQKDLDDIDQTACGDYEEEVELTDEDKAGIVGDIECHRRMTEGWWKEII